MKILPIVALPIAAIAFASPASAQISTVNDPAPGYSSLLHSDFANAEREIRGSKAAAGDPAAAINLGIALAKTGHRDEAAQQFRSVLMQEDVEMVVANGETVMSHAVAERALASLQNGALSR